MILFDRSDSCPGFFEKIFRNRIVGARFALKIVSLITDNRSKNIHRRIYYLTNPCHINENLIASHSCDTDLDE